MSKCGSAVDIEDRDCYMLMCYVTTTTRYVTTTQYVTTTTTAKVVINLNSILLLPGLGL